MADPEVNNPFPEAQPRENNDLFIDGTGEKSFF